MNVLRTVVPLLLLAAATLAITSVHAQDRPAAAASAAIAPHAWSSLDPAQQEVLAPLRPRWDNLSPRKQARMLERAERWATLPPSRREEIRQRIDRWQQMTPAQREEARANRRKFRELPPQQRERLHTVFERFQHLPPAQREQLIRQWHSQTIEQRLRGLDRTPHAAGQRPGKPPGE